MSDSFSRRKALTWIICTVIVVLGLPAGAFAVVAGSNTFITDPGTGHRAHVNTSGQLLVNTGGSSVKVSNTVPVSGTVRANTYPLKPFTATCTGFAPSNSQQALCHVSIPTGETFVVQSASMRCERDTNTPARVAMDGYDTNGHPITLSPVPGPDGSYLNSWWDTNAQLSGTAYITGLIDFQCVSISNIQLSAWGTAQGYLYP